MGELATMVGSDLNTVKGFNNGIVSETSHMDVPTVVNNNNKTTAASKLGKAKPVIVHENNNGTMKLADTRLESNNILSTHIMEEKEGWFYEWTDNYDVWNNYSYIPTKENEPGSSHTCTGDNNMFKLAKKKHNRRSKSRLVSEVPTFVKSDFYFGERQS